MRSYTPDTFPYRNNLLGDEFAANFSHDPNYDDFVLSSYNTTYTVCLVGGVALGLIFLVLFVPLLMDVYRAYGGLLRAVCRHMMNDRPPRGNSGTAGGPSMREAVNNHINSPPVDLCEVHFRPLRLTVILMSGCGCVALAFLARYGAQMAHLDKKYTHLGQAELYNITTEARWGKKNGKTTVGVRVFVDMAWDFCPLDNTTTTTTSANSLQCRSRVEVPPCAKMGGCRRNSRRRIDCTDSDARARARSAQGCVERILGSDPLHAPTYLGDDYFANNYKFKALVQCPCTQNFDPNLDNSTTSIAEDEFLNANSLTIQDPYIDPIDHKELAYICLIIGAAWSGAITLFCGFCLRTPPWAWGGGGNQRRKGCCCCWGNKNDDNDIPMRDLKQMQREFQELEKTGYYDASPDEVLRSVEEELGIKVDWERRRRQQPVLQQ